MAENPRGQFNDKAEADRCPAFLPTPVANSQFDVGGGVWVRIPCAYAGGGPPLGYEPIHLTNDSVAANVLTSRSSAVHKSQPSIMASAT